MLSRVADNLYWMSRYLERAEHTARVMDVHISLMLDQSKQSAELRWNRLMASLSLEEDIKPTYDTKEFCRTMIFDPDEPASIFACVANARENCRQVRGSISSEMFEQLNRMYLMMKEANFDEVWSDGPNEILRAVKEGSQLFQGITDSTLSADEGWHFTQMGRYMERAQMTTSLLDAYGQFYDKRQEEVPDPTTHLDLVALLKCCTAFEAYCRTYTARLKKRQALEFLLLSKDFPHAVRFSVDRLAAAIDAVSGRNTSLHDYGPLERLAGRVRARLHYTTINEVLEVGLKPVLADVQADCGAIHSAIYDAFITYPIEKELVS